MPRRPHLSALLLASALALTGCGNSRADDVSPATRDVCRIFLRDLPDRVADQKRTSVDRDDLTASYGDPAITVTCGVGRPDGFKATSTCQVIGQVGWFVPPDQIGHTPVDVTATTVDRRPRIRIEVPKDYWPSTATMVDLGGDIAAHLDRVDLCG